MRIRLRLPGLILLSGLLMTCRNAPAHLSAAITPGPEVTLTATTVYYDVVGASADELRAQLDWRYPTGRQDAYTDWWVQWGYDYAQTASGCSVRSLSVTVDVTITFPHWTPPGDVSPELEEQWRAYLAALRVHEDGHKRIALEAANEIATALSSLPVYPSCAKLERDADATGQRILERYRQQELTYDRETEHGDTQGARFP
jgi:predicted secreted Zn-dependent protease